MRKRSLVLVLPLLVLLPTVARAGGDSATVAEALFDEGKRLLKAGDFAAACPKFEASLQIEHADGTLIALALCHEEAGRLASAWTEFTDVIAEAHRAGRTDREALAREHVASLEPRLSRLTIVVPDQAAGMTVKRDSAQAVAATWGVAIPVDPGPHVIVVEAPGKRSWSTSVTIGSQADSQTVTVPALQDAVVASQVPAAETPAIGPVAETSSGERPVSRRPYAFVAGGIGLASVALGSYFGAQAISSSNQVKTACPGAVCRDQASYQLDSTAKADAVISDIAVGAGLACIAAGAYLYFSEPRSGGQGTLQVTPTLGRTNGLVARVRW